MIQKTSEGIFSLTDASTFFIVNRLLIAEIPVATLLIFARKGLVAGATIDTFS